VLLSSVAILDLENPFGEGRGQVDEDGLGEDLGDGGVLALGLPLQGGIATRPRCQSTAS